MQTVTSNQVFGKKIIAIVLGLFLLPSSVRADGTYSYKNPPVIQNGSAVLTITNKTSTALFTVAVTTAGTPTVWQGPAKIVQPDIPTQSFTFGGLSSSKKYTVSIYSQDKLTKIQDLPSFGMKSAVAPPAPSPTNKVPVVNAGVDQTTKPSQEVLLEGIATDADGVIASYLWTKESGSGNIKLASSNKTTVTDLTEGTSVFKLTAKDNKGGVGTDTLTVTVKAADAPVDPTKTTSTGDDAALGSTVPGAGGADQCTDGIDNQVGDGKDYGFEIGNGDGKADRYGLDTDGDGELDLEPDPSCFSLTSTIEQADDVASTIIPCTDKCTFGDVFKLLNNLFTFFFKVLLMPLFIVMIVYAGFSYLRAQFNGGKKVELKSMFLHMVGGIILILCAWLIVHTILVLLGYEEGLVFFQR